MYDPADQRGVLFEGNDIMDHVSSYLLSVCGAALLCGIADRFLGKSGSAGAAKILTGLFLAFTVLNPLGNWNVESFLDMDFDFSNIAEESVAQGQAQTQKSMANIIKQETAAYILEKAKTLHADIQVSVEVSDDALPIPVSTRITGNISPYVKLQLQTVIEQQLGISKENQRWT